MRDITVADVEYRELLGGGGRLGEGEWWVRYNSFMLQLDESIEESVDERERLGWMRLKKDAMELGAKVSGLLKQSEGGVQIDKLLVVVSERADALLERYK